MIKAIDTIYKNHKFRSRLEARWAVFFDEIGWSWEYEKEGFVLEDGTRYLPDFYLSQLHTWVEVKPDEITDDDKRKCGLLSKGVGSNYHVMIANGLPAPRPYMCFTDGEECCEITLSSYIRMKQWSCPYFGGDWEESDKKAMIAASMARFEFGEKNI